MCVVDGFIIFSMLFSYMYIINRKTFITNFVDLKEILISYTFVRLAVKKTDEVRFKH
jgi:hypothetical protein